MGGEKTRPRGARANEHGDDTGGRRAAGRGTAAAAAVTTYPCKECGRRADDEVLPVSADSHRMPAYWCRACRERTFRNTKTMTDSMRKPRAQGAIRDLKADGGGGGEADGGQGRT